MSLKDRLDGVVWCELISIIFECRLDSIPCEQDILPSVNQVISCIIFFNYCIRFQWLNINFCKPYLVFNSSFSAFPPENCTYGLVFQMLRTNMIQFILVLLPTPYLARKFGKFTFGLMLPVPIPHPAWGDQINVGRFSFCFVLEYKMSLVTMHILLKINLIGGVYATREVHVVKNMVFCFKRTNQEPCSSSNQK